LLKGGDHVVHAHEGDHDIDAGVLGEQVLEMQNVVAGVHPIVTDVAHPHLSPIRGSAEIHLEEVSPDFRII
jgi:hypothetical protein